MNLNQIELMILVNDRAITQYYHDDKHYVEGRAGSEYEIEVYNHTGYRVEAVLSVDGLSVLDGKLAGTHSTGYLIDPRGKIRIPGWTLNSASIAKFKFAGKQKSYATQMTGDDRNTGVIGVMVFREKFITQWPHGITCSASSHVYSMNHSGQSGISANLAASNMLQNSVVRGLAPNAEANVVQQSLGTAFGESAQFATHKVVFQRGALLATLVCHYDERRGLKARGIRFERHPRKHHEPQAFPAITGCTPPPGWTG
jgi:hypothetical protein